MMMVRWTPLLLLTLAMLLGCVSLSLGMHSPSPTDTPCPPHPSPERYMYYGTRIIREALEDSGLTVSRVQGFGAQDCPDIEQPDWGTYSVDITVEDMSDWTTALETVVDAWPDTGDVPTIGILLYFSDGQNQQEIDTTVGLMQAAQVSGLRGPELVEVLQVER